MIGNSYDDLIWSIIGRGNCAYKHKTTRPGINICSCPDSVNGKCERDFCPLANAQYATIREFNGRMYLLIKVIERQHLPAELWERIEISLDYVEAYRMIKEKLKYWDDFIVENCLLKLKKLREKNVRMKKLR